jgi:hypothetical protein
MIGSLLLFALFLLCLVFGVILLLICFFLSSCLYLIKALLQAIF